MKRYYTNSAEEWVKIVYRVVRDYEMAGDTGVTILKDFETYSDLRRRVKEFCKDFTGKGEVAINLIASSFSLTDKESQYFSGRVFKFNKYQSFLK